MDVEKNSIYSLDEVKGVAQKLAQKGEDIAIITFTGPLGVGKTTLVKNILRESGVTDVITSPTFTYVNCYKNQRGRIFYHFDLYRIESVDNFIEAGFNEYLYAPNSLVLIEWPEIIIPLLTHDVCHITLDYHQDQKKRVLNMACIE